MDVEKYDVNSGYGSMNTHTDSQNIVLESLMNDNDKIDTYINENLQNGVFSSGIGLLNRYTPSQDN